MITSRMNRNNTTSRSPRIFIGILLLVIVVLVFLYYNEHQTAKKAAELTDTLKVKSKSLYESIDRYNLLKKSFGSERQELAQTNIELRNQVEMVLKEKKDCLNKYDQVVLDKKSLEEQLERSKEEVSSLQQRVSSLQQQSVKQQEECDAKRSQFLAEQSKTLQQSFDNQKNDYEQRVQQCDSVVTQLTQTVKRLQSTQQLNQPAVKHVPQSVGIQHGLLQPSPEPKPEDSDSQLPAELRQKLLEKLQDRSVHDDSGKLDFGKLFGDQHDESDSHSQETMTPMNAQHAEQNNVLNKLFNGPQGRVMESVTEETGQMMRVGISHNEKIEENSTQNEVSLEKDSGKDDEDNDADNDDGHQRNGDDKADYNDPYDDETKEGDVAAETEDDKYKSDYREEDDHDLNQLNIPNNLPQLV